jgi:hypothetical protein
MKVYIAGPYTKGDVAKNVRTAIDAANTLLEFGFTPFVPHLTHFWHMLCPHEYQVWLDYDYEWLKSCDVLIRLRGESPGADIEVKQARLRGMPVFNSVVDFLKAQEIA